MFRQYVYVVAFLSGLDGVSSHHSSHDAKKSWRINHQSACGMFKRFQKKVTKICMVSDVCCVPAAKQWMIFEVEKKYYPTRQNMNVFPCQRFKLAVSLSEIGRCGP